MALPIIGDDTPDLNGFTLMQAELNYLRQQNSNLTSLLVMLVPDREHKIEISEEDLINLDPRKALNVDRVEGEFGSIIEVWTSIEEDDAPTD